MDYSTLIEELLDGTLDTSHEERLLRELLANPELRLEFRDSIAIKTAIPKDFQAFVPSAQSSSALFSRLNIDPSPLPQEKSSLMTLIFRYRQGLLSGLVSCVLTSLAFLFSVSPEGRGGPGPVQEKAPSENVPAVNPGQPPPADIPGSPKQGFAAGGRENLTAERNKDFPMERKKNGRDGIHENPIDELSAPDAAVPAEILSTAIDQAPATLLASLEAASAEFPQRLEPVQEEISHPGRDGYNLQVHLRNFSTLRLYPERSLIEDRPLVMNNLALGVSYRFTDKFSAGVEAGRESFPIYRIRMVDEEAEYESKAAINYIGVSSRLAADPFDSPLQFFGLGLAGASDMGPLAKLGGGVQYGLSDELQISLGAEYSGFFYRYEGAWHSTRKMTAFTFVSWNF